MGLMETPVRFWYIFLTVFLLLPSVSIAKEGTFEPLVITIGDEVYEWGKYAYYFEDQTASLSIDDIASKPFSEYTRITTNNYGFGYNDHAYWLRLELQSDKETEQIISLAIDTSNVEVYKYLDAVATPIYRYDSLHPEAGRVVHSNFPSARYTARARSR